MARVRPRGNHDKLTIVSMAVIASAVATLLHEGLGHGLVAFLRGAVPMELTSNHLTSLRPDKWVEASGTLVNLAAGMAALLASLRVSGHINIRYFLWLLAALNLLPGAGYFLFSGILGLGDWNAIISDLPNQALWRALMVILGAALYLGSVKILVMAVWPYCKDRGEYNVVGRLPYLAACLFSCAAGALDPMGWNLLLGSTIPAAFGGSSGLLWADNLRPRWAVIEETLVVARSPRWWVAAVVLGGLYIAILGPGIKLTY